MGTDSVVKVAAFVYILSFTQSHTHDEIPKCFLTGVHRMRQTIIVSPKYPDNYNSNICWDYVIRSPFKCPTTFHIQFLEFDLEFSEGCKNDYLAIGWDSVDDDVDMLCGQMVGIKKYHTPDGVLRLRFFADEFPWTTGKGFKLLITRLACERDELLRKLKDEDDDETEEDDSIVITPPPEFFQLPELELLQIFRNLTGQEQYQNLALPPIYGSNYPTQLPFPPYAAKGTVSLPFSANQSPVSHNPFSDKQTPFPRPCSNDNELQRLFSNTPVQYGALKEPVVVPIPSHIHLSNFNSLQLPQKANNGLASPSRDQYVGSWSNTPNLWRAYNTITDSLQACCVSAFQQKHFYLSSPGFPHTIFSNILPNVSSRDCIFRLKKASSNICRLRLDLKFFDFGQNYEGSDSFRGNTQSTQDDCKEDFIELDNQRFCGCRSGFTFTAYWPTEVDKKLRMRMGYSGVQSGGFLLELLQEECSKTELAFATTERPVNSLFATLHPNLINNQLDDPEQDQQISAGQQNPHDSNLYGHQQQKQQQTAQTQPQNVPIGQHILNTPPDFPTYSYLQQPNFFFTQQQKQPPFLYPSPFGFNYFTTDDLHRNRLHQTAFGTNAFGLPPIRYSRSSADQQPMTVVETNSTRKEYYYAANETPPRLDAHVSLTQTSTTEKSSIWDRRDTDTDEHTFPIGAYEREARKCNFDMADILRLSVDILWITKPICYAPQRNWLTNWIG